MVKQHPVGRNVTVYFEPKTPELAMLNQGVATFTKWESRAGTLFMSVSAWLAFSGLARILLGVSLLGFLTFAWLRREKK